MDESFLNALEYGRKSLLPRHDKVVRLLTRNTVPPTGGWGLGIDRLAMVRQSMNDRGVDISQTNDGLQFITNNYSIREVLAFPFLREENKGTKEKFAAELVNVQPLPEEGIRK